MASNLRVDTILPSTGTTLGIGTASGTINFLGNSNIVTSGTLTAASASITGNLGVGGTLTYEDVTNIDSVGVITARSGGYLDIRTGSSINTNATGSSASGTIHKNTNSGEFAVVSGGTGGNNHLTFYTSASAAPTEKLRITSGGHISQGGGAEPSSSNGSVAKKFGIKSNANNVIIGETESSGNGSGLHIESRQTGRSGDARIAQIGMKNDASGDGQISFFTAPNGSGVVERMVINSSGHVTKPATPFFSVYGSASNQTYNQGDIITFENAVQNVGNHFKMTSGTGQYQRFIAPVAGVYLFTFAFFPNTASACRIGLRVSTALQTTPYISGCFTSWGTGSPVPSASQMLLLGADAYVDVVVANGTLTNTYDGHTTFQGILLG